MARLRCPDCRATFPVGRGDADEPWVRCPDCGARVENEDDAEDDRPRRKPARKRNPLKPFLIAFGILGVLGLLACGGIVGLVWWSVRPTSFPEQTEDYADARKTFRTTLTRTGKSPQSWEREIPPPGVTAVPYTSGGLKLQAWVDAPPAGQPPKPAVLFLHGGFAFGAEDWEQCAPFRDAGFVTMVPILRGENGQPGSYTLFYDETDDAIAAAEVLATLPGVDPNRVFVAGHSAGGTVAMLAAMTSKRFQGCASFSGSPDQVAFVRGQEELAPFDVTHRKELEMRSPLAYPKSFKCPARLYWGDEEFAFQFSTRELAEKAQAAGSDVQAIEVPGDHFDMVAPAIRQAITFFRAR